MEVHKDVMNALCAVFPNFVDTRVGMSKEVDEYSPWFRYSDCDERSLDLQSYVKSIKDKPEKAKHVEKNVEKNNGLNTVSGIGMFQHNARLRVRVY